LVFEKNANFFAENRQKSQKIVIITSTPDHLYDKNRQAIAFPTGCFFRNGFVAGRKFHLLAEGRERVRVFDRLRRKDGHLVAVDLENKSEAQSKLSQHWPSHPPKKIGKKIFRVKYLAMVFYKMST
jgi:hypothetical protein